jgi:hypothetical protein
MSLYTGLHIFTQPFFCHGAAGGKKLSNFGRKPSISLKKNTPKIGSLRSPDHASPLLFLFSQTVDFSACQATAGATNVERPCSRGPDESVLSIPRLRRCGTGRGRPKGRFIQRYRSLMSYTGGEGVNAIEYPLIGLDIPLKLRGETSEKKTAIGWPFRCISGAFFHGLQMCWNPSVVH